MIKNTLYLEILKRAVSNYLYLGGQQQYDEFRITKELYSNYEWQIPRFSQPHTVLAAPQLNLIERLMIDTIISKTPGDYLEAGIFRGGTVAFMRGVLKAFGITDRIVWAADSFEGIPGPEKYPDVEDDVNNWPDRWVAGFDEVKSNIERYGLLDDQIRFIKGYFADTLPAAPCETLALVRLDADSYESTMDALDYLYPKISHNGYVIIDDWVLEGCRDAVLEYREKTGISGKITEVKGKQGTKCGNLVYEAYWKVKKNA